MDVNDWTLEDEDSSVFKTTLTRKTALNRKHLKVKEFKVQCPLKEGKGEDEEREDRVVEKSLLEDNENQQEESVDVPEDRDALSKAKLPPDANGNFFNLSNDSDSTSQSNEKEDSANSGEQIKENNTSEQEDGKNPEHNWERNTPMGFTQKLNQYRAIRAFNQVHVDVPEYHHLDTVEEEPIQETKGFETEIIFSRKGTVEDPKHATGRIIEKPLSARNEKIDPFRFFEVAQEPFHLLKIRVICGRNISKGRIKDFLDTPDPYVIIHIRSAPNGRQKTEHRDNDANPVWNESFEYLLPTDEKKTIAEISLMDSNYAVDEVYNTVEFDIVSLPLDKKVLKTFSFNETSEVDIEFWKEMMYGDDLRSSLALCQEEKDFRSARKRRVKNAMTKLMEKQGHIGGPRGLREVPTVAVLGSGGGFRAMTGYAGAIKALNDTGILDCCTYVTGLSGSSWYLAALYADENFPEYGTDATRMDLRDNIKSSPFWLLSPQSLMRYSNRLHSKMKSGQPVTFTDFFGMLIGQTLLGPEKMKMAKLSDFRHKIRDGLAPMPVMTCLHVRPKTSAMTFHDWVEFTPYEIGMAKYATFMKSQHFGSKFFKGALAKEYDESPLHFLMGVWGSAFSILFQRLVAKSKGASSPEQNTDEDVREEIEQEISTIGGSRNKDDGDSSDPSDSDSDDDGIDDDDFEDATDQLPQPQNSPDKSTGMLTSIWKWGFGNGEVAQQSTPSHPKRRSKKGNGFLSGLVSSVFWPDIIQSREYRAGKILNYMRGVSLNKTYPISPFTPKFAKTNITISEEGEFQQIYEPIEVRRKKVHLVDAGLTFNSPYPPMLRPQRAVDLIISFDFSSRPGEDVQPFKEILLAEKWAKMHELPFPTIDTSVYQKDDMKECYVFKDESNERAPIVVHFTLCNSKFRKFSKPGVPREAEDSRGDFNIFDNPKSPYSTFNFQYSNEAFDQLHDLMEFNTLLHVDTIIKEINECVKLRRRSHVRCSVTLNDIRNSVHMSIKNKKSLETALLNKKEENQFFSIDN